MGHPTVQLICRWLFRDRGSELYVYEGFMLHVLAISGEA
jgi:hypothetical protein